MSEARVWRVDVRAMPPDLSLLTPAERARGERFVFPADRQRFYGTRLALRRLLGNPLIAQRPGGKPYVAGGPHFSVAHAGDWGLVAICAAGPVGVDLEPVRPLADLDALARTTLGPAEYTAWQAEVDRTAAFYRAWTRKEAVLKATGDGLRVPLSEVDVRPAVVALGGVAWTLNALEPAPGYVGALALPPGSTGWLYQDC